jgi:Lectin C-type domain
VKDIRSCNSQSASEQAKRPRETGAERWRDWRLSEAQRRGSEGAGEAGSDTLQGVAGSGEMSPDTALPLDMNGSEPGVLDASTSSDATADAALPPDARAPFDAGPIADACTSAQGTLEPGSSACLIFVSLARVTWQAADLACQSRNAQLVSVKTSARNDFLTGLIGTTTIWIGANDAGTDPAANAFAWRDMTAVNPMFPAWATGEPDMVPGQFCVCKSGEAALPPGPAAPWRDRACSELNAYVCELNQ